MVLGHKGIADNETANSLAKQGSGSPLTEPEPACSILTKAVRTTLRDWRRKRHPQHWKSITGWRQAKLFHDLHFTKNGKLVWLKNKHIRNKTTNKKPPHKRTPLPCLILQTLIKAISIYTDCKAEHTGNSSWISCHVISRRPCSSCISHLI